MRQKNFPILFFLCLLQAAVPAWGTVLCIGYNGHLAIEAMQNCDLDTSEDSRCDSVGKPGDCSCCLSEKEPEDCRDVSVLSTSLTSGSAQKKLPMPEYGRLIPAANICAPDFWSEARYGKRISDPFYIESGMQTALSSVVLLI